MCGGACKLAGPLGERCAVSAFAGICWLQWSMVPAGVESRSCPSFRTCSSCNLRGLCSRLHQLLRLLITGARPPWAQPLAQLAFRQVRLRREGICPISGLGRSTCVCMTYKSQSVVAYAPLMSPGEPRICPIHRRPSTSFGDFANMQL